MKIRLRNLFCALLMGCGLTALLLRRRAGSVVLCYHRVNDRDDPIRPGLSPARLRSHLHWLGKRFRFVSAVSIARDVGASERRLAITFDDGYPDNISHALSALDGRPATLFLVTGTRLLWTERIHRLRGPVDVSAIKRRLKLLDPSGRDTEIEQLERLHGVALDGELLLSIEDALAWTAAGQDLGAHTETHPILTECDSSLVEREVSGSRRSLADALGAPPPLFAYPGGAWNESVRAAVEIAGFEGAYATGGGWITSRSDRFALPRIDVRDDATVPVLAAELAGILPALRRIRGRSTFK